MKIVSIAVLAAALSTSVAFATMPPLTAEAIDSATFEEWQARQGLVPAVLTVDARTGDVEAADGVQAGNAGSVEVAVNTVPVPILIAGQSEAVVVAPAYSSDVPDDAGAQIADDPEVLEEVAEMAEISTGSPDPFLVRLQILLDRAHASPGAIDGFFGGNTRKAIAAYEEMRGLPIDGEMDADVWTVLAVDSAGAIQSYEITAEDVGGRYVETMPEDYAELAKLDWLGYADVVEMLAEKFHMDRDLLKRLNPEADFTAAGTTILVAATAPEPAEKVMRIVVDKAAGELRAYNEAGKIVLVSPATIGSADNPSPAGTLTVAAVAPEPTYSYDPETNFQQGDNAEPLTLPPGPNGPVGSMWIDLSQPTFGIHGTPDPEMIDKSRSHGCVRLTNWDASKLAALVEPGGTVVEFRE